MVISRPIILEIAEGSEHLAAAKVLLPVAIAAGNNQSPNILESRRVTMRLLGPVGTELSDPDLEEQCVVDDGAPLALPNPSPGGLLSRRPLRLVDCRRRADAEAGRAERVQAVCLMV